MISSKSLQAVMALSLLMPAVMLPNFTIQPGQPIVIDYSEHQADTPDGTVFAMLRWGAIIGLPAAALGFYADAQPPATGNFACTKLVGGAGAVVGALYGAYRNSYYEDAYEKSGHLNIHATAAKNNIPGLQAWLAYGENPAKQDSDKRTPMHYAAGNDSVDALTVLRNAKPVVEVPDGTKSKTTGYNYGHYDGNRRWVSGNATESTTVNTKDVKAVEMVDDFGNTPAHIAARCARISALKRLFALGASVDATLKELAAKDKTVQNAIDTKNN